MLRAIVLASARSAVANVTVDAIRGASGHPKRRFGDWPSRTGNRQHHAVVHRIRVSIQNLRADDAFGCGLNRIHDRWPPAFTEVGHALDEQGRGSNFAAAYHLWHVI